MTNSIVDFKFLQEMQIYFQGEKTEALIFILPIGLLSLVFGAWLLIDNANSFTRGVAIPFVLMGLLMGTVGGIVGFRTPGQIAALEQSLQINPKEAIQNESERMAKVNKAWPVYLTIWGIMGVVGLGFRFLTPSDFLQGMGISLVFFAGVALLVDGFAERRTHPYVAAIEAKK